MDWHKEYPSTVLRTKFDGDEAACRELMGFGKDLLFRVKSMMGTLKQLNGSLHFSDGSIIRVSSIFGQDTISIYRPPTVKEGERPHCMVSLINVPLAVPPSRWYQEGIHQDEESGYHYFKTYYAIGIADCPECWGSQLWSVCQTDKLMADIGLVVGCRNCHPFIFDSEKRRYHGGPVPFKEEWTQTCMEPPTTYPADPDNHCLIGACQGEILEFDADAKGSFFLWKAYTEWSCAGGPQIIDYWSKTGLGYMLLEVKIIEKGKPLCSAYEIVKVDCCEKRPENRELEIWWESLGPSPWACWTCCYQPFMFVGSMQVCKTPHLMGLWYLINLYYAAYVGFFTLYFIEGSCPPFEWTILGPGELKTCPPYHDSAEWKPPANYMGCEDVVITTRDRCGSEHTIRASCCNGGEGGGPEGGPLGIAYSTLAMGFNQCQDLHNSGGCPPYSWSVSGGGSITVDPNDKTGGTARYCSPDSNQNCEQTPTIKITDCCGNSAEIEIAVTIINDWIALHENRWILCWIDENGVEMGLIEGHWWHCDGREDISCYTAAGTQGPCPWCYEGPCDCGVLQKWPPEGDGYYCKLGSKSFQCHMCALYEDPPYVCDYVWEWRTPEMMEEGCCPPDPLTG